MKTISVSEFKKHCLSLINTILKTNERITITKYGKPVAELTPLKKKDEEDYLLKGSILFEKDLISPIEESWEAEQ